MFFKDGYVYTLLKSSIREFHNLMDNGIEDFCKILVRLRGTDTSLLLLKG